MKTIMNFIKNKTVYGSLMVFLLWYGLHYTIHSNVIPSPYHTVKEFLRIFPDILSIHLIASLVRIVFAVCISILVGVPMGLWMGMNKRVDALISPIIYILYPLPKIAFLPVFMILFGMGDLSKIILIITIIFFQILLAARDGVKEIPKEFFYSVSSLGLSTPGIYQHLILPAVLPRIISGIRINIGISISTLFFAENFATTYGIGYYIMNAWTMVDYLDMFSGILGLSLLGILLFEAIDILEKKLCAWVYIAKY